MKKSQEVLRPVVSDEVDALARLGLLANNELRAQLDDAFETFGELNPHRLAKRFRQRGAELNPRAGTSPDEPPTWDDHDKRSFRITDAAKRTSLLTYGRGSICAAVLRRMDDDPAAASLIYVGGFNEYAGGHIEHWLGEYRVRSTQRDVLGLDLVQVRDLMGTWHSPVEKARSQQVDLSDVGVEYLRGGGLRGLEFSMLAMEDSFAATAEEVRTGVDLAMLAAARIHSIGRSRPE